MWGLLILLAVAHGERLYNLDEIETAYYNVGETVVLESREEAKSAESWVVGHLPSDKIIVQEGRMGTRYKDTTGEKPVWVQKFTFLSSYTKFGNQIPVEFWFIKPHFAEQYFNDPEAYAEMNGGKPKIKIVNFEAVRKPEL